MPTKWEQRFTDGIGDLILYTLDHFDLIEHGGGIGGSWLTEKGIAVRDALAKQEADGYTFLIEQACCHGYLVESELLDCPECGPLNKH